MSTDIVIANSVGITKDNSKILHSPSRWSEIIEEDERFFCYYPFHLAYLSSLLKKNTPFKIKMIDGVLNQLDSNAYYQKISKYSPRFLFMDSSQQTFNENLNLAMKLKQNLGTVICFGGPYVSAFPDESLNHGIDYVFTGEYENSVLQFFLQKQYESKQKVFPPDDSLTFKGFPWPEDDDVTRISYSIPGEPSSDYKEIQIYGTRGCNGSCSFCVAKSLYYQSKKPENRDPEDVVNEMNHLNKKHPQIQGYFFDEEDHFCHPSFNEELCHTLINNPIPYKIEALGRFQNINDHLIPLLKKAGYYKLRIGIETFDHDVQKAIHKTFSYDQLIKFLKLCKKHKIKIYGTFQVGLPESTLKKDRQTLSTLKQLIKKRYFSNVQISIFTPLPGTPSFQKFKENRYLKTFDYSQYNGGSNSVVNNPSYPSSQINQMHELFLTTRDHEFFKLKLTSPGECLYWIFKQYKNHSLKHFLYKILKKIKQELDFLFKKNMNEHL